MQRIYNEERHIGWEKIPAFLYLWCKNRVYPDVTYEKPAFNVKTKSKNLQIYKM